MTMTEATARELITLVRELREDMTGLKIALHATQEDMRKLGERLSGALDEQGRKLRMVANFAGMTDPHDGNGNGGG